MPSSMPSNEEEKAMYYFIIRHEMQGVRYRQLMCNEFGSKVLGGWGSCVINGKGVRESVRGVIIHLNPTVHFWLRVQQTKHILCMLVCEFCVWRNSGMREVGGIKQRVTCIWLLLDLAVKRALVDTG